MKNLLILANCIPFVFAASACAEGIHIYKHTNGDIVITNISTPEEHEEIKNRKTGSSRYATAATPASPEHRQEKVQASQPKTTHTAQEVREEKKYLETEITRLQKLIAKDADKSQYYKYFLDTYKNDLQLLEKDPNGYFLKQEQARKQAVKLIH